MFLNKLIKFLITTPVIIAVFFCYRNLVPLSSGINFPSALIEKQQSQIEDSQVPTFGRESVMSENKKTNDEIFKKCEEMSRWSCERVGQFLDEINLGKYKEVGYF